MNRSTPSRLWLATFCSLCFVLLSAPFVAAEGSSLFKSALACDATLTIGTNFGEPASSDHVVDVMLTNSAPVRGVQVDVVDHRGGIVAAIGEEAPELRPILGIECVDLLVVEVGRDEGVEVSLGKAEEVLLPRRGVEVVLRDIATGGCRRRAKGHGQLGP